MIAPEQQQASAGFFVPVVLSWGAVFLLLEVGRRLRPEVWPAQQAQPSQRPWFDLLLAVVAIVAVLGLGQLWRDGTLRWSWPAAWGELAYLLQQLLIWSPLPLFMALRRQPACSAWTGARHLFVRAATGVVLGLAGVLVYSLVRGEPARIGAVVTEAATVRAWAHFVPVYLEGVGIAFLFVRLRWALGAWPAALVPGLLFALAHVPGGLDEGRSVVALAGFFAFNTAFVTVLLLVLQRYRDVVALGVAHWLTDIAIGAF